MTNRWETVRCKDCRALVTSFDEVRLHIKCGGNFLRVFDEDPERDNIIHSFIEGKSAPVVTEMSGFKLAALDPWPAPVENAFRHDLFHVGTTFDQLVVDQNGRAVNREDGRQKRKVWATVFYHDNAGFPEKDRYLIVVDHETGKRIKVVMPKATKKKE